MTEHWLYLRYVSRGFNGIIEDEEFTKRDRILRQI